MFCDGMLRSGASRAWPDERLHTSILGRPEISDFLILTRFSRTWAGLTIRSAVQRYEDISRTRRRPSVKRLTISTGWIPQTSKLNWSLASKASSENHHLPQGGEWQKYYNEEHKALIKAAAGDILIKLGYEKDNNW
jgi:hypothetical protein